MTVVDVHGSGASRSVALDSNAAALGANLAYKCEDVTIANDRSRRPIGISKLGMSLRSDADMLVVRLVAGPELAGVYGPLRRLARMANLLVEPLAKTLAPLAAAADDRRDPVLLEGLARRAANLGLWVTVPAMVFLALFAGELLDGLYGEGFAVHAPLLLVLLLGPAIRVGVGLPGVVLQMSGQAGVVAILNIGLAVLGVPVLAASAWGGGLWAVAWATVGLHGARAIGLTALARRRVGIRTWPGRTAVPSPPLPPEDAP